MRVKTAEKIFQQFLSPLTISQGLFCCQNTPKLTQIREKRKNLFYESYQYSAGYGCKNGRGKNVSKLLDLFEPFTAFEQFYVFFFLIFVILGVLDTEKALKISQRGITIRNIFLHRFNAHMHPFEQLTQNRQNKGVLQLILSMIWIKPFYHSVKI